MRTINRIFAALALAALLIPAGQSLAAKDDYCVYTPEQIIEAVKNERREYRETREKIYALENSGADKTSPAYKKELDALLEKAVQHKINLDWMAEALDIQQRSYGGN